MYISLNFLYEAKIKKRKVIILFLVHSNA